MTQLYKALRNYETRLQNLSLKKVRNELRDNPYITSWRSRLRIPAFEHTYLSRVNVVVVCIPVGLLTLFIAQYCHIHHLQCVDSTTAGVWKQK